MKTDNTSAAEEVSFCTEFNRAYLDRYPDFTIDSNDNFIPDIVTCVVNCIFAIPAIVGNIIVISAILSTPSLRSPSNILLCSVFASDLLTGLIVQPSYVLLKIGELRSHGDIACFGLVICVGGAVMLSGNSFISLTFLSVDKWLGLHYHLRYREMVTIKKTLVATLFSWLISLAGICLFLQRERNVLVALVILIGAFLFSVNIFVYISILKTVKRHENQIHIQLQATQQLRNSGATLDVTRLRKSTTAVFILYTLFLLCMAPLLIAAILYAVFGWSSYMETAVNTASTLCFINSSLNPLIYVYKIEEIRLAVKRHLRLN